MVRHRMLGFCFVSLALVTTVAIAQTATAPLASFPADYSTPVGAVKSYVRATFGQDAGAMREALLVPPARAGDVDARLVLLEATRKLQAAARKEFGAVGVKTFASPGPTLEEQLKNLDEAKAAVKGDTATVTLPAGGAGDLSSVIVLKKSGDQWKVDAGALFDLDAPADKVAGRTELARKVAGIAGEVAKDILGHKFHSSATDAYQDFWARCQMVATAPATGTGPAAEAAASTP